MGFNINFYIIFHDLSVLVVEETDLRQATDKPYHIWHENRNFILRLTHRGDRLVVKGKVP